jgi:xanthine dehydrogenase accessory factor
MSTRDPFEQIATLRREGQSFALATVVARRPPVSAHLGDRAIVYADGRMDGFIGGACSREIIRRQGLDAMKTRLSRLVSIRPDATEASAPGAEHVIVPLTCVSEGAVDVYVEPFVPARRLIVVGATPVAEALARVGRSLDYDVVRVVDAREQRDVEAEAAVIGVKVVTLDVVDRVLPTGTGPAGAEDVAAVVASQGHYDEEALERLLRAGVPYVGLVASRKRGATVRALLERSGVPGVASVRNPAGLDLGARTPPEVALSILAEIVQASPRGAPLQPAAESLATQGAAEQDGGDPDTAIDPVCQMTVDIPTARYTAQVDGATYYFCCQACRTTFLEDPSQFVVRPA